MPWQNQGGGGPWGGGNNNGGNGGGNGGGPWGRGSGGGSGGGGGRQPPNIEDLLKRGQDRMRGLLPGGFGSARGFAILGVALVAIWMASGFYRVQPDQQGVVLTFGRWSATTQPGLNWHWPAPIETAITQSVTRDNRTEIGFRSGTEGRGVSPRELAEESLMLTGDENIVDIDFTVFWRVKDAGQYLFGARDPSLLVKVAAESTLRENVAKVPILQAFTEGRGRIEADTKTQLQILLDKYQAGIEIRQVQLLQVDPPQPVVDAFNEVQRARADRERLRNEAETYRNGIIPRARGDAEKLLQEAQAYREEVVNRAQGDAKRFLAVYEAYKVSKDVTTERIYLETLEQVLKSTHKILIDKGDGPGVVPYLPLPTLGTPKAAPAAPEKQ